MSLFKRLSATISSQVDQLVGQIENHDAVVESSIREARQAIAKSKVRLSRLNSDGARLKRKLAELKQAENNWSARAKKTANDDEDKALACLRRRQECQRQMAELNPILTKHSTLEARLSQDIRLAEERIMEMSQQRNLMRTRESAADALNSINHVDDNVSSDLAETFERWEIKVTEAELEVGSSEFNTVDDIEQEFIDIESREALRAELKELMEEEESNDGR